MIGIPPATAASKKTNELLSLQLLFISFQYLETRALFAVITFFPFLSASNTISFEIPSSPPISSNKIS